MPSMKMMTIIL